VDPAYIRTKTLAAYLGISNSKANEIVQAGRIRSIWLDGVRLIPIEEARTFAAGLAGQTTKTTSSPADRVPA